MFVIWIDQGWKCVRERAERLHFQLVQSGDSRKFKYHRRHDLVFIVVECEHWTLRWVTIWILRGLKQTIRWILSWCLLKLDNFSKMCQICCPIIYSCFQTSLPCLIQVLEHFPFLRYRKVHSLGIFIISFVFVRSTEILHKHLEQIANTRRTSRNSGKSFLTLIMKLLFAASHHRRLAGNWQEHRACSAFSSSQNSILSFPSSQFSENAICYLHTYWHKINVSAAAEA